LTRYWHLARSLFSIPLTVRFVEESIGLNPYQQRTKQRENPTQQLIKQAVDYLLQQLDVSKSETLTAYLGAMARFHNNSSILAIARQRPTATRVASIRAWNELGRFVRKGEKGIHEARLLQLFPRSLRDVPARNKTIAGRTHIAQHMLSVLAPLHGPAIAVTSNQRPQIPVLIQLVSSLPFT
jgi:hypothetical protein